MRFEKVNLEEFKEDVAKCFPALNETYVENFWEDIKLPKQATVNSMGIDFFSPFTVRIMGESTITIPTGIKWIADGHTDKGLCMFPRSGMGFNYGIHLMNTVGIIDADYEKDILIKLHNPSGETIDIRKGAKFVQGIIIPYYICDNAKADTDSIRTGGFGSTDKEKK